MPRYHHHNGDLEEQNKTDFITIYFRRLRIFEDQTAKEYGSLIAEPGTS
jgi:hypothetical protein